MIALGVLMGTSAALLATGWYMGVFIKVRFTETVTAASIFIFTEHVGPYQNVGAIFGKLFACRARFFQADNAVFCGMMSFDDPSKVTPDRLRSFCGLLVPPSCADQVATVTAAMEDTIGLKFETRELRAGKALHTYFPLRNTLSYMLGPLKVYPAARNPEVGLVPKPGQCHGCPLEIYRESCIEFIFPLEHPEQYAHPKGM